MLINTVFLTNSLQDVAPCGNLANEYAAHLVAGKHVDLDPLIAAIHSELAKNPLYCWRRLHTDACILAALTAPPSAAIAYLDTAIIISGAAHRLDDVLDAIEDIQTQHLPLRQPNSYVFPIQLPLPPPFQGPAIPALAAPPSLAAFQSTEHKHPFILRGYASDWPALNQHPWASTDYLRAAAGRARLVPVEVGRDYRSDDWSQKLVEWDAFLASLDDPQSALYLAQHSLLMQFPKLRADIHVPDYVYADVPRPPGCPPPGNDEQLVINAWFGPKDTVSPAHTDPYFNMYVQVVGYKTVWLAPPSGGRGMYATGNTSAVDVFSPDRERYPVFEEYAEGMTEVLGPGDLLYIPAGWWHSMRSESRSCSISMWF